MNTENSLSNKPLPAPDLVYNTDDFPAANGKTPPKGTHAWKLFFTLEDGRVLCLRAGKQSRDALLACFLQEDADDTCDRLLG